MKIDLFVKTTIEILPEDLENAGGDLQQAIAAKLLKMDRERKPVQTELLEFCSPDEPDYTGAFGPHPWREDWRSERAS